RLESNRTDDLLSPALFSRGKGEEPRRFIGFMALFFGALIRLMSTPKTNRSGPQGALRLWLPRLLRRLQKAPRLMPWLVSATFCVFGCWIIGRDPVRIGGDEGIEFSMALLTAWCPAEVPKMWNDQPW